MTQDEIIEMAKEAGLSNPLWIENDYEIIETFASLVEAKATAKEREACVDAAMKAAEKAIDVAIELEREACAKVAEHRFGVIGSTIALAIKARGET
jgi:hypothetical protein